MSRGHTEIMRIHILFWCGLRPMLVYVWEIMCVGSDTTTVWVMDRVPRLYSIWIPRVPYTSWLDDKIKYHLACVCRWAIMWVIDETIEMQNLYNCEISANIFFMIICDCCLIWSVVNDYDIGCGDLFVLWLMTFNCGTVIDYVKYTCFMTCVYILVINLSRYMMPTST